MGERHRKREADPVGGQVQVVRRRCCVCEWEGEMLETLDSDPDCQWCHAPTERVDIATSIPPAAASGKNPHAAALGRLGGLKGGQARAKALSAAERHRIASRAARARWRRFHRDQTAEK
jgi:hypothetical protein